jgi:HSP20 family protein
MSWRRRRREDRWGPWFHDEDFGEMFTDIEEDMRRVRERMNNMMRHMAKGGPPAPGEGGPFVYGFSLRVGPDGKPQIREFGNTRMRPRFGDRGPAERPQITAREPVTDVVPGKEDIAVTFEMPGVGKKDIDLEILDDRLTISAKTEERTYDKEVELPHEVDSDLAKATYNNGVLEIVMPLAKPKERKGKRVKVD